MADRSELVFPGTKVEGKFVIQKHPLKHYWYVFHYQVNGFRRRLGVYTSEEEAVASVPRHEEWLAKAQQNFNKVSGFMDQVGAFLLGTFLPVLIYAYFGRVDIGMLVTLLVIVSKYKGKPQMKWAFLGMAFSFITSRIAGV